MAVKLVKLINLTSHSDKLVRRLMMSQADSDKTSEDVQQPEVQNEERKTYGNNASAEFLNELKGQDVIVKQNSGVEYRGSLSAVDGFLNVVLRNAKEIYHGKEISELGELFLRGSSVEYIAGCAQVQ